ncbi:MAG: hypothetical protein V2I51_09120 [Anderseniella sp.]|nr:hypothetical protein [Anderseniella sp.]
MSRAMLRAVTCALCVVAIPVAAWSQAAERQGQDRVNAGRSKSLMSLFGSNDGNDQPAYNTLPAQQTPSIVGDTSINIAQPQAPDAVEQPGPATDQPAPAIAATPEPAPAIEAEPQPRRQTASGSSSQDQSEADWWNETGNPAVFTFRDCLSGYSRAQARQHPKLNLKSVLADAIKGECRQQFETVSVALAGRFGERRGRKMAEELSGSTFVPAVREAVLGVRQEQKVAAAPAQPAKPAVAAQPPAPQPQPASTGAADAASAAAAAPLPGSPQPVGPHLELAIVKEEMFTCYRVRTDRAGPQPGMPVDAVVDQVLLDCSDHTRAFFKRLFEVYPHPPAQQADKMREAIAQNYRPAIASRVEQMRTAGASAAPAGSASSTVLKSATSTAQ